ncbi:hypothetical protein [Cardinium endosymbiont of Bemisia tabaci]|uniref:hypothetical protein n=1 Tax=Candidatus Cardinium TaxID=273135 RepID=UPI000442D0B4|nr:hypothetical protein [Cardinium endosymbiont of Bemisia tabaci]CDG49717.1 Hypothetical protein CHV_a0404 [Cardinium endosymbiont cBtQ1 of Bemisia tabaci]
MSLLEDNSSKEDHLIIARFEKTVAKLLQVHANYQKKILDLTEENQILKSSLEASKRNPSGPTANHHSLRLGHHLVHQINQYIKEIDLCLAYFEQV